MDPGRALFPRGNYGDCKKRPPISGPSSWRLWPIGWYRRRRARSGSISADSSFFGLLVTIWLVLNECISILENISEIGVPLPSFLVALIQKLKKTTENKGEELLK